MIKKFLSFSVGTWVGAVIGAITVPVLTHFFSPEEFGKASMFTLALNMIMLFSLFGVDQTFIRFYYEEKTNTLLLKSLKIIGGIFLIVSLLLFGFREDLSIYLFGEYSFWAIFSLWISVIFYLFIRFGEIILRMEQNGKMYSLNQILLRLADLVVVVLLFFLLGGSYKTIIFSKVLAYLLVVIFLLFVNIKIIRSLVSVKSPAQFDTKYLFKYSYPLALTGLLTWLFQSADRFAIKEWSTMADLGIYVTGFRIVAVLSILRASFCTYWTPLALERFLDKGEEPSNMLFFRNVCGVISIVMFGVAILIIAFKNCIPLLLGDKYFESINVVPFLVFMPVMYTISEVTYVGIDFYKKPKYILLISIIVCVFNIIGNVILVPYFGGIGAAISTCLSYILFFILRTYFSQKFFKVNFPTLQLFLSTISIFTYAIYSAFVDWNYWNSLVGILVLSFVLYLHREFILILINYFKSIQISKNANS